MSLGDYCQQQKLTISRVRDDWVIWDGLVKASSKLGKKDAIPSIDAEKDDWRIKRLHMMASLQATVLSEQDAEFGAKLQNTLQSAKDFFSEWQTYPFCYSDIKDFVDELPSEAQADFLKHVSKTAKKLSKPDTNEKAKASNFSSILSA